MFAALAYVPSPSRSLSGVWRTFPMLIPFLRKYPDIWLQGTISPSEVIATMEWVQLQQYLSPRHSVLANFTGFR